MKRLLPLLLLLAACQSHEAVHHSLQVTYELSDGTTQVVQIDRPYRAREGSLGWSEDGTYLGAQQSAALPPGFPGPYSRLDVALPEALAQGLVRDLGTTRTVAGRSCHEWESRQPLDGAPFAPATRTDRTVSCVDGSGLLLADTWTSGGRVLRTRTATSVGDGPSLLGNGLYGGSAPTPLPTGSAVVTPATPEKLLGLLQVPVPAVPAGLHLDRSVAVVELSNGAASREGAVLTYVSGDRMLVLRLSRALVTGDQPTVHGAEVRVGPMRGRLLPVLAGLQLHLDGPRGLQVTVTTDLPREQLLSWAGGLHLGE